MKTQGNVVLSLLVIWLLRIIDFTLASSCDAHDFRLISYNDLLHHRFSDANVTSFSRLLFDVSRNQIIVGARDTLYVLSYDLKLQYKTTWAPTAHVQQICLDKGQHEDDCRNYIMVLHAHQDRFYVCGTNAFSPLCAWYTLDGDNALQATFEPGVAKCPFNPRANVTSLITDEGQMYVGTATDFSGSDHAIVKTDLQVHHMLRTDQYNRNWLYDPQFVGSFEAEDFIYFVFREVAIETVDGDTTIYSRIARVCKSDSGGTHILRDNWTSFAKARLNCSLPGNYPFYFNEVQDMAYSQLEQILYATFTTPENSMDGSAICAFNLTAINKAFHGPFRHLDPSKKTWEIKNSESGIHNECQISRSSHQLRESAKYQLMYNAVQPIDAQPLHHVSGSDRFSHIAFDAMKRGNVTVLYVATLKGTIRKISFLPHSPVGCLLEVWRIDNQPVIIRTIQFLGATESLYVGTEASVIRLPAHNCQRHVSKSSCLNSMDVYCGWNSIQSLCTSAPNGDIMARHWVQNATTCPIKSSTVDGGWSSWSPWSKCAQNDHSNDDEVNPNTDHCLCRTRSCDNPKPENGGKTCAGLSVQVTNCTVHGGWTEWSAFSPCSQSCGIAVKTRKRTCSNPRPAFGGRVCVGPDRSDIYCTLAPCPAPELPQIDGGWGPWGTWGDCSVACGGGFRMRRRKCDDPEPSGGMDCIGCNVDYELCNKQPCAEMRKLSHWTPWMVESNTTNSDEQTERRFRYMCKGDGTSLKIMLSKDEKRKCSRNGSCQRSGDSTDGWGTWGAWSPCSASCGGGQQFRTRQCEREECEGSAKSARACNSQPCQGEWSCWTDWSPCSVSCGVGRRTRTRDCLSENECVGDAIEYDVCEFPSCDSFLGWSPWSEWSPCNTDNERVRKRTCLLMKPNNRECQGEEKEVKECLAETTFGISPEESIGTSSIVRGVLELFSVMVIVCLICYIVYERRKVTRFRNGPSSPHYSVPNQYCSLPTRDITEMKGIKVKRQLSVTNRDYNQPRVLANETTLTKSNNVAGNHRNTPKVLSKNFEYETATMKKNYGLNNHRAAAEMQVEDIEKF